MRLIFALSVFLFLSVAVFARETPRLDLELRAGGTKICMTCATAGNPWRPSGKAEILGDITFPLIGTETGYLEAGVYAKAAGFYGTAQGAGGAIFGFRSDAIDILGFLGLAYAGKRVVDIHDGYDTYLGQSKNTYDLGFSIRLPISDQFRFTFTIEHNSNGGNIGLNMFHLPAPPKENPGMDSLLVGISWILF